MARGLHRHWLTWTAVTIQLLALLIGFLILYSCTHTAVLWLSPSETIFWSTLGLLRFMFFGMAFPLTIFVLLVMLILFVGGSRLKRFRFLWVMAFVVWGAYWLFLAYTIC